jgi:hypothetical protein
VIRRLYGTPATARADAFPEPDTPDTGAAALAVGDPADP